MSWIFFAALQPIFYGAASIIDQLLANRRLPETWALIFYACFFNLAFLPIIILIDPPHWPSLTQWPLLVMIGFTGSAYLLPYYRSLQIADTSIVSSLFSLGRIFIPLTAFIFVGERLSAPQYIGFTIIVIAATLLTFHPKKFRFNSALWYMTVASLIVVPEAVAVKYLFGEGVSWGTLMTFSYLFGFLWATLLLVPRGTRHSIITSWRGFISSSPIFALEELLTFVGSTTTIYAISLVPLTYVMTVDSFTPVIVLLYAILFRRWVPTLFKEEFNLRAILTKVPLFALMTLGVWVMSR